MCVRLSLSLSLSLYTHTHTHTHTSVTNVCVYLYIHIYICNTYVCMYYVCIYKYKCMLSHSWTRQLYFIFVFYFFINVCCRTPGHGHCLYRTPSHAKLNPSTLTLTKSTPGQGHCLCRRTTSHCTIPAAFR